jgi:RNA polymerase sigma factor (sigma-70 family)
MKGNPAHPIWLAALQNGHHQAKEKAFMAFLDVWHVRIYEFIRRMMGNHEDAQDVTQETLVQVFKSAHQFKGQSAFSSWVFTIASRKSLDALKRRKRTMPLEFDDAFAIADADLQSDALFSGDEAERWLHAALAALPPRQRQVFTLRYFEALPYSEIASMTGTSEGSLKASYHHAVVKIKGKIATFALTA